MPINKALILAVCLSLLPACTTTTANNKSTNMTTDVGRVSFSPIAHARTAELLEFMVSYVALPPESQKSISVAIRKKLSNSDQDTKLRIQQGAILSLPNSTVRDTVAAQNVLQQLLDDNALNASNENLVKLLLTLANDHNNQQLRMRDEAKKTGALKQKNKALKQQLKGLKDIEKTMIKRNTQLSGEQ